MDGRLISTPFAMAFRFCLDVPADRAPRARPFIGRPCIFLMSSAATHWRAILPAALRGASGRLLLKLPAPRPAQTYHFTVEEALAIIDKAQGRWKTFFRVLAETGMRPGELAGLMRDAIGDRALTISQSVWGQRVQMPKSRAGIRTFAISGSLAEDLRKLVDATSDNDYGLVFVTDPGRSERNPGGKPLSMDNFRHRVLNPILKELASTRSWNGWASLGAETTPSAT
jgi:integrase